MRSILVILLLLASAPAGARESLDVTEYGIVYTVPGMAKVKVRKDLPVGDGKLKMDLYLPAGHRASRPVPVVIFVNGVGDAGPRKLKDWRIYQDWPRLVAAHGYAAIIAEATPGAVPASIAALFEHVAASGAGLGLDVERVAAWACSANVSTALPYLMDAAPRGVRAAVFYYGNGVAKKLREDLPVFHVLAGKDGQGLIDGQRLLWKQAVEARAPWTMVEEPTLPHAFDAVDGSERSRRAVKLTLAFLDAHLGPLPAAPPASKGRDVLAAIYGHEHARAATLLEERIAADPQDTDAVRRLALLKVQRGDCAGAEPVLRRAVAMGQTDGQVLGSLAHCEFKAGRFADAARSYEQAIAAGARFPNMFYNLACAQARAGRADPAFAALETAVQLGFADRKGLEADEDLVSLRGDPRWKKLVEKIKPPAP